MWYDQQYAGAPLPTAAEAEFQKLDGDHSGSIDIAEMRGLTIAGRSMTQEGIIALISVFAEPGCGTVSLENFRRMYRFLEDADKAFKNVGRGAPRLPFNQIHPALVQMNLDFPPQAAELVSARIDARTPSSDRALEFNEFLLVACFFAALRSTFQRRDTARTGTISFTEKDFALAVAGLP